MNVGLLEVTNVYFDVIGQRLIISNISVRCKAVPLHAMEALGGEELLLINDLGTRWG
jgi:hypothetical protein